MDGKSGRARLSRVLIACSVQVEHNADVNQDAALVYDALAAIIWRQQLVPNASLTVTQLTMLAALSHAVSISLRYVTSVCQCAR